MKELFLDTTIGKESRVTIKIDGEKVAESQGTSTLETIKKALEKAKLTLAEIDTFDANPGPGSYTGIRIGLTIINTLNWAFGKNTTPLEPKYQ